MNHSVTTLSEMDHPRETSIYTEQVQLFGTVSTRLYFDLGLIGAVHIGGVKQVENTDYFEVTVDIKRKTAT